MFFRFLCAVVLIASARAESVRLKATADIWVSDAVEKERNTSAGKCPRFKLKTIQEMAAIRFDPSPARGRRVLKATLFLRRASSDMLRYIRVSTVNADWVEGNGRRPYGPPDGATFMFADARARRPWSWPGSQFCDVIMGSGNSIATWAERRELPGGWIAVPITPELVYAMVAGDTDGLAVMDGGNPSYHNNMFHSVQSPGGEPYMEVELGERIDRTPAPPRVSARPAPERSHLASGAIRVQIQRAADVFCWRLSLDGEQVERWRVPHPKPDGPTTFYLEDLPPGRRLRLSVVAVAPWGAASRPTILDVESSPTLPAPPKLGAIRPPAPAGGENPEAPMRLWALPPLVKLSPITGKVLSDDTVAEPRRANAVWNGAKVALFGGRGEYVSFQLCVEKVEQQPLRNVRLRPSPLRGPKGASIGLGEIELFANWYAQNRDGAWQPAYCLPIRPGQPFEVPDPRRKLTGQTNQTFYVDIYIPREARAGTYRGKIEVSAEGSPTLAVPVEVEVFDFALPDRLSFWPELNAYHIPRNAHDYYRLAHQHRCVANFWRWQPRLRGSGRNIQVVWDRYDQQVGPLLTGEAFKSNRRAGVPVRVMYLPFEDSWPTPLSKKTYDYQGYWPRRGDDKKWIIEHYLKAPYIADGLSRDYKDAFLAVQRQFIAHFRQKGYERTEMQCFFGGKNTHRIRYGSNMWWTTDEPYHWDDWLAVRFFCRMWTSGRGRADKRVWAMRADISRPQWQDKVLDGVVDVVYFGAGAFNTPAMVRRCRILAQETGLTIRTYGSANRDNESNTRSVAWLLSAWLNGAEAALPWQTLGSDRALDVNDRGTGGGNALLVPGERFGLPVVADMRLKALRDGQQLVEYLVEVARRRGLRREQLRVMVAQAVALAGEVRAGASLENAEAARFASLKAWQIAGLRRRLAELITAK